VGLPMAALAGMTSMVGAGRHALGWLIAGVWVGVLGLAFPGCTGQDRGNPTLPGEPGLGHHAGSGCQGCHPAFLVAGTVFATAEGKALAPSVAVVLTGADGSSLVLESTDAQGNFASAVASPGSYVIRVGDQTSKSWHRIPEHGSCNECHGSVGHNPGGDARLLPSLHTRLPVDNQCSHCHHFPATMAGVRLKAQGVLHVAGGAPPVPGSRVRIGTQVHAFDPLRHNISSVRPDIFAPGYFSMFDVILAVAREQGISVEYHWDPSRKTHFIDAIDGRPADYWYRFSYDAGSGNQSELGLRREYRWDEALWRPGVWIAVTEGEALGEIKAAYLREIQREEAHGPMVPLVTIAINPSAYQGNPPGSNRVTVTREFRDVRVSPHDLRAAGAPGPFSRPFQPGVVTSLDVLLSLRDQGELSLVSSVFYTYLAGKYIDSHYVVALGFPGVGTAHASGRHGFTYTTGNGSWQRMVNDANRTFHITADIAVLHAPDFSTWVWRELGNPYYESVAPSVAELARSVAEDHEALGRGFNLHRPVVGSGEGEAHISFNLFEPALVRLTVRDSLGSMVALLEDGFQENLGVQTLRWGPGGTPAGTLYLVMECGGDMQVRRMRFGHE
jgi:hypothetical protein